MISDWKLPDRPRILPPHFISTGSRLNAQRMFLNMLTGLSVLTGLENHDGKWWLHVSCAHAGRLPTWEELKEVKDIFIGPDELAIQVLPSAQKYVNPHPYCLHLFSSAGADWLLDFASDGGTVTDHARDELKLSRGTGRRAL
jgi:hypothetical protein